MNKKNYSEALDNVVTIYGDDFELESLKTQLQTLACTVPAETKAITDILQYTKEFSASDKELLNQIIVLTKLILVMLATNSSSERSFSAM